MLSLKCFHQSTFNVILKEFYQILIMHAHAWLFWQVVQKISKNKYCRESYPLTGYGLLCHGYLSMRIVFSWLETRECFHVGCEQWLMSSELWAVISKWWGRKINGKYTHWYPILVVYSTNSKNLFYNCMSGNEFKYCC